MVNSLFTLVCGGFTPNVIIRQLKSPIRFNGQYCLQSIMLKCFEALTLAVFGHRYLAERIQEIEHQFRKYYNVIMTTILIPFLVQRFTFKICCMYFGPTSSHSVVGWWVSCLSTLLNDLNWSDMLALQVWRENIRHPRRFQIVLWCKLHSLHPLVISVLGWLKGIWN